MKQKFSLLSMLTIMVMGLLINLVVPRVSLSKPSILCAWETEECASVVFQYTDRWVLEIRCGNQTHLYEGADLWSGFCPE